ncbi:splicing factor 3B subunit 2 [Ciona intestinalis]
MKTLYELNQLTVHDLRQQLDRLGIPSDGRKSELVNKLLVYYEQVEGAYPQEIEEAEPPAPGEEDSVHVDLPVALEKVLAYKNERAKQVGVSNEEMKKAMSGSPQLEKQNTKNAEKLKLEKAKSQLLNGAAIAAGEKESKEDILATQRKLKNKKKRAKKKRRKAELQEEKKKEVETDPAPADDEEDVDADIEYVTQDPNFNDPHLFVFKKIFQAFKIAEEVEKMKEAPEPESTMNKAKAVEKVKAFGAGSSDEDSNAEDDGKQKLSKKKLRRMNRLSVAELKQLVTRPDVVEMHDVTAQDPRLLVHLKASRNSVTVPRHWCFKRKYLQGKRGFEKPPFELPQCIKNTGIMEMRQALQEKEDQRTLKTKMREKVRPKLGKIDIDYQKLHDAFFRYQTKPRMTTHGDLYYEGKEFETRLKEKKPGNFSDELRLALGMPVGEQATKIPPPWLIAMQRYGPPPSYPNLKIMGLNCPIPESCSFGYHAGGWGKPPVDEMGRPLYGDVFGTQAGDFSQRDETDDIDKSAWGDLESESEEESSEEEESEGEEKIPDETGFVTPAESGMITPSGISSVPSGMETPDMLELRKRKIEDAMEGGDTPQLFTVLPEKSAGAVGRNMMASAHVYDVNATRRPVLSAGVPDIESVEVALNPEELELDNVAMAAKYEQRVREQEQVQKEDFSDMVAEHAAKQKKKRKAQTQDTNRSTKKYKEFKF